MADVEAEFAAAQENLLREALAAGLTIPDTAQLYDRAAQTLAAEQAEAGTDE